MAPASVHNEVTREIERLSGMKLKWPRLPPALEARFEQNVGHLRSLHLRSQGLVALVLFDIFSVIDYYIGDGASHTAMLLHWVVITPISLLVILSMRWKPGPIYREASVSLVILLAALSQLYLESNRGATAAAYAQAGVIIAILFANLVMRQPLPFALATSTALVAGDLLFLRADHFLHPREKMLGALLTGFAFFISMIANYSFGRQLRLVYLMLLRNEMQSEELVYVNAELHRLSSRDNLTGLANRNSFDLYSKDLWQQCVSAGGPLSAILIDIDRFKAVNDLRGHLYGDKVLTRVASLLQQSLRGKDDFAARFGGEEFVVLLPQTTLEAALIVAERIRKLVEVAGSPAVDNTLIAPVMATTVSCGVATCLPNPPLSLEDLLEAADKALYDAKRRGRNRVCSGEVMHSQAASDSQEPAPARIGAQSETTLPPSPAKVLWG